MPGGEPRAGLKSKKNESCMGVERYEVLVVFFNSVEYETKMHVN